MKLFQTGRQEDKDLAKKLFPKMRSYAPIVVLEGPNADKEKVLVWAFGSQIYQKLLGYFMNEKVGDYFDPHNGFNLTVKVVQNKGKQYPDINVELDALTGRCPLNDDAEKIKSIVASIPDIKDMWPLKDAATIERELNEWLNAGHADDGSNGTQRGNSKSSIDDLESIVNDVKKDVVKSKKAPTVAKKVESKSEPKSSSDDLDDAFKELLDEEN